MDVDFENIDFDKGNGLLPAIVQDNLTGRVLMLGYMNRAALERSMESGLVTFYSRSRQELWTKGDTSGNRLHLKEVLLDCDGDALLIKAKPQGPVCHTGEESCFTKKNLEGVGFLAKLEEVIGERREQGSAESYTSRLFQQGRAKIAQKVGEEATEVIVAALAEDDKSLKGEFADLFYHLLVLLQERGISLREVIDVLIERHRC